MRSLYHSGYLLLLFLFPLGGYAQIFDCPVAQVICSDSTISFDPAGQGFDDFENPNNDEGCLQERERISAWYYFEFRADMPPNSVIEFTITAQEGGNTDYDFAIYGPDLDCDSLGTPLRCSFADPNNVDEAADSTGLRPSVLIKNSIGQVIGTREQTETSEGRLEDPLGRPADGFVAPMVVQPQEGFYLLLDYFQADFVDTIENLEFQLRWGGSAAPFLNCIANPRCKYATADAGPTQDVCAGDLQLQLNASVTNTNGGETYTWQGVGNTTAFLDDTNSLQPQINIPDDFTGELLYTLTVEEGKCVKEDSVRLTVRPAPEVPITGDSILCPGSPGALQTATGFDRYQWSTGSDDLSTTIPGPGTYSVIVEDDLGCTATNSVTVDAYPIPRPIIRGDTGFCEGNNTRLSIGPGYQAYAWSNGSTDSTTLINAPGKYYVTVTSDNGCEALDSVEIVQYDKPDPAISGQDYFCEGGAVTLTASGNFDTYAWNSGERVSQINVDEPGLYFVTVRDQNGCLARDSLTVREEENPEPRLFGDDPFCSGTTAILRASTGFQQYQWSTGGTEETLSISQPGTYTVTVTNALGCEGTVATTVDTLPAPRPQIQGFPAVCRGDSIFLSVRSGFSTYRWSTGNTTERIKVKTGGNYGITVTNDVGCSGMQMFRVESVDIRQPELDNRYELCTGDTVLLDPGAGFLDYQWSDNSSERELSVTQGGTYRLTVTDENNCVSTGEVQVDEFTIQEPVFRGRDEFCSGQSISLFVEGPYVDVRWSTQDTVSVIEVAEGGRYTVTVTDGNGCMAVRSKDITENESPLIDIQGDTIFCQGDSTILTVDPRYEVYTWTDGRSQPSIVVKEPGFYGVLVRAENGCTTRDEVNVQEVVSPSPEIFGALFYCPGESTLLDAGKYNGYQWSDGSTARFLKVSTPGIYAVTVTNEFQCTGETDVVIRQLNPPRPEIETQQYFCAGEVAELNADSNFVQFNWSTGDTTYAIQVAEPGDYDITLTDKDGCEAGKTITLEELPVPAFELEGPPHFCEGESTTLTVSDIFSRYAWSNGEDGQAIEVADAGFYMVTVTNPVGCTTVRSVEVASVPNPVADAGPPQLLDCRRPLVRLGGPGSTIGDRFNYRWSGPGIDANNDNQPTPPVSAGGIYLLQVADSEFGCLSNVDTVRVEDVRFTPQVEAIVEDTLDCRRDSVLIDARNSERNPSFTYQWRSGLGTNIEVKDPFVLSVGRAGVYDFIVTDTITGCNNTARVVVMEDRAIPVADAGPERQLDCRRDEVQLDASNTLLPDGIRFEWTTDNGRFSSPADRISPFVDRAGIYRLRLENEINGCTATDSVLVVVNRTAPTAEAGMDQELNCDLPEVTLNPSGSSAGETIRYQWRALNNDQFLSSMRNPSVDSVGTYVLLVTDTNNGCTAADTVFVTRNENLPTVIQADAFATTCFGDQDGRISIAGVTGGEGPYVFSLNDGPFFSVQRFDNLEAGTYTLTAQDINGCEITLTAEVESGNDLRLDVGENQTINLGDSVILQAIVNIPPSEVQSFQWERPESIACDTCTDITVRPIDQTTYGAVVVDNNGCVAEDNLIITVLKKARVYIPNAFSPNNDGHNDRFLIFSGNDVVNINFLQIYSRWGEKVFEGQNLQPNNPDQGWDGRHRGRFMNPQVLVYFTEIEFLDGRTELFKGDVNLVR